MMEVVVLHLSQLIERLEGGRLHIPMFPRSLVWEWDRKHELLRSVRDGIPMGSVMLWRTNDQRVSVRSSLAGHRLPSPPPDIPREYLIDGLQRLSTLYLALRGPGTENDDEISRVGYDLQADEFVEMEADSEVDGIIPLDVLGNAVTLLRAQRKWRGPEAEAWMNRSDELARAFREYQVHAVTLVSNDLELAIRTFKMINSQGVAMDEADMVHALTWSEGIDIRERIETLRAEHLAPHGWEGLDDETVLKVVKADAGIDLYDRTAEAVSRKVKEDPTRLDSAVQRLALTAKLLSEHGIRSWSLVPYGLQPVLIAAALDGVERTAALDSILGDWFWLTTYGEMFAGLSGHRIAHALAELRQAVQDGRVRWSGAKPFQLRGLPRTADFKSVRIKALAMRLASEQHTLGSENDPFEMLAAYGRQALASLLTPRHASRASCSSPANRFLCPPSELTALRRRILDGEIEPQLAAAHLIPPDAITAAQNEDWDGFVASRRKHIEAQERSFVDALRKQHGIGAG